MDEEIYWGLKGLAHDIRANGDRNRKLENKPRLLEQIRKRPPAGDAIRWTMGLEKPTKGTTDVPEPETDGSASDASLDSLGSREPDGLRQEP